MAVPSSATFRAYFAIAAAKILRITTQTFQAQSAFYDDQNLTYGGNQYRAEVLANGFPGQLFLVGILPGGNEFTYPFNSAGDVAVFEAIMLGGPLSSYVTLYSPQPYYVIAAAASLNSLVVLVNQYLSEGYRPVGSVFSFSSQICQPMMLPS